MTRKWRNKCDKPNQSSHLILQIAKENNEGRSSFFAERVVLKPALFFLKVLSSHKINATTLYRYTVGNESEIAKLLHNKDGGKNAMRLASTLLSVMSETSEEELKTEEKIKVGIVGFQLFFVPDYMRYLNGAQSKYF